MKAWFPILVTAFTFACAGTESGNPSFGPDLPAVSQTDTKGVGSGAPQGPTGGVGPAVAETAQQPPRQPPATEANCNSGWGSCALSSVDGRFDCSCSYYTASRRSSATTCSEALDACRPEARPCQDFSGFCDLVAGDWSCQCVGGTPQVWSGAVYGSECGSLLNAQCAHVPVPAEATCSKSVPSATQVRSGHCAQDFNDQTRVYRCGCSLTDSSGVSTNSPELTLPATQSCASTLEAACFAN
ncbi:MAG: hypothetical protein SFV15_20930 [Polyangiaceae bacterium]|nr:hypothetical protein [Polyangiaceae bacterium]